MNYIRTSEIDINIHHVFLKTLQELYILKIINLGDNNFQLSFENLLENTSLHTYVFPIVDNDLNNKVRNYCLDILYNHEIEIHIFQKKTKELYKFLKGYYSGVIKTTN